MRDGRDSRAFGCVFDSNEKIWRELFAERLRNEGDKLQLDDSRHLIKFV
jgi:hypothetical protein